LGSIVINEINYNPAPGFDIEDWIELYNFSDNAIDISGWTLKDSDDAHSFVIPANTVMDAPGYFVRCRDKSAFLNFFPNVTTYTGNFSFGLNNDGELIRLYDNHDNLIDSLCYDIQSPWPVEPDGKGFTLELKSPALDNALSQSWAASTNIGGTPVAENSVFTAACLSDSPELISFKLFHNYPNPFNLQTTIKFSLLQAERVALKIFNVRGEAVKTLINEKLTTGSYQVTWDGTDKFGIEQSSGIYFCCLIAGSARQVTKMVLIQ